VVVAPLGATGVGRATGKRTGVMSRITPVRRIARKKRLSITARGGGRGRWDRVEPAGTERVATGDATQCEPAATPGPVPLQRLDRVLRTRRMIAA
jgi:hypothetical protein